MLKLKGSGIVVNEFGEKLDRNGYANSILYEEADESCFLCHANGYTDPLNRHEVFGGAFRDKSKRIGLWVSLCHNRCHQEGKDSVHKSREKNLHLKRLAQMKAMKTYHWDTEDFIREFGKNYLED